MLLLLFDFQLSFHLFLSTWFLMNNVSRGVGLICIYITLIHILYWICFFFSSTSLATSDLSNPSFSFEIFQNNRKEHYLSVYFFFDNVIFKSYLTMSLNPRKDLFLLMANMVSLHIPKNFWQVFHYRIAQKRNTWKQSTPL